MRLSHEIPEGYEFGFEEYLFNELSHRKTQSEHGWKSFYLINDQKRKILASWHINFNNKKGFSPLKATFGGIDFSIELTHKDLSKFIRNVIGELKSYDCGELEVTLAPSIHNQNLFSKQFQSLIENNFILKSSMLVSAIAVNHDSFESKINATKRNLLRRSEDITSRIIPIDNFHEVYGCINQSQIERNYKLSMSESQLEKVIDSNKDRLLLFGVYKNGKIIGAIISMLVLKDILYIFYAGHLKEYDKQSPLIKLYETVYIKCQELNIRLIDLGSSEENGITKHSLVHFKNSLGAVNGLKVKVMRNLND